jgi:hypothetical protein
MKISQLEEVTISTCDQTCDAPTNRISDEVQDKMAKAFFQKSVEDNE